jgi:hypothetical protein
MTSIPWLNAGEKGLRTSSEFYLLRMNEEVEKALKQCMLKIKQYRWR